MNYANLCKKSHLHYKSLIKASKLLIFGTYILFNILSNCALKNFSIEINFLCILLFYEFLMYFFVFSTFCFYKICQPLFKHNLQYRPNKTLPRLFVGI